ncbi:MAG: rod-binding protein [Desulfobacterales bacterium]|jgi:flagellar protein FlgJ
MTDPLSLPKIPVNLSHILYSSEHIQRTMGSKTNPKDENRIDPQLREACVQMESLFIYHLFKEMRATIQKSGFISGGRAEEIYTSMLDAEMAVKISKTRGMGLAEMLMHQFSQSATKAESENSESE